MVNFLISLIILGVGTLVMYLLVTDRIVVSSSDNESKDVAQFATALVVAIVTIAGVFFFSMPVGVIMLILGYSAYRYFIEH